MWHSNAVLLTLWAGLMPFTMAEDPVYVTDMEVFPLLVRRLFTRHIYEEIQSLTI